MGNGTDTKDGVRAYQVERIIKYLLSPNNEPEPQTMPDEHETQEIASAFKQVPLTLQPFFKEDVNLNAELIRRFPSMPLMSVIKFRTLYSEQERGVATLSSQDGSAALIVDVSHEDDDIQFSFTYGSMLSLRFYLRELSDLDKRAWLESMENRINEVVFLWGQSRWEQDYVIAVPHKYYISLLAFSQNSFEAAVRMTPEVAQSLFDWLREYWDQPTPEPEPSAEPAEPDDSDSPSSILSEW